MNLGDKNMTAKIYKSFIYVNDKFYPMHQSIYNLNRYLEEKNLPRTAEGFLTLIGNRCVNTPSLEELKKFFLKVDLSNLIEFDKSFPNFYYNISDNPLYNVIISANPVSTEMYLYLGTVSEVKKGLKELPSSCIFLANKLTKKQKLWLNSLIENPYYNWSIIYL